MTDLELVSELRRAVHPRRAGSIHLAHDHHPADFAFGYVRCLHSAQVQTLLCGGTSYWLYHLHRTPGFDTFVINTGVIGGATHVMVVAARSRKQESRAEALRPCAPPPPGRRA